MFECEYSQTKSKRIFSNDGKLSNYMWEYSHSIENLKEDFNNRDAIDSNYEVHVKESNENILLQYQR